MRSWRIKKADVCKLVSLTLISCVKYTVSNTWPDESAAELVLDSKSIWLSQKKYKSKEDSWTKISYIAHQGGDHFCRSDWPKSSFITKYCGFQFPSRFNVDKINDHNHKAKHDVSPLKAAKGGTHSQILRILGNTGTFEPKKGTLAEFELVVVVAWTPSPPRTPDLRFIAPTMSVRWPSSVYEYLYYKLDS